MKPRKTARISQRVEPQLVTGLAETAEQQGKTLAIVLREAIRDYVASKAKAPAA